MKEEVFNGIKYKLDEERLTADVIGNVGLERKVDIPEVVVFNEVSYRVTRIKVEGFSGYSSLTSITIPNSVTEIGARAFANCHKLTDITIPDSVTSIGERAFLDCESLEEIVIGNSVKSIGVEAFYRCDMLTNIRFQGTIAQWGRIELGDGWNDEVCTTVVSCSDGDVEI